MAGKERLVRSEDGSYGRRPMSVAEGISGQDSYSGHLPPLHCSNKSAGL